ncbi:hypothetical protein [Lentibacillus kapialis]|uniref:hypothetical protein n=1 Tax=Lentibacillus kapialis TaxID=340214 RepID=UPI0016691316|nr:hypothetical protein [Lentibacillus kapialis]
MGEYHTPNKYSEANTKVLINNFRTENPNYFDSENLLSPAKMILEIDFYSKDYSPEKFTEFMEKFTTFLKEEGYS